MNTSIAVVGPAPIDQSASPRGDGSVAVFAGMGTSLILAALVLAFGRARPFQVSGADKSR